MSFLESMLGPKSKYDKSLPYTYEARLRIFEESGEYKSYFSDTICGLVEYLHRNSIPPDGIEIFGVYQEHESPIDARFFTTSDRQWLFKPDICRAFQEHYPGHIQDKTCSFKDRARAGIGP